MKADHFSLLILISCLIHFTVSSSSSTSPPSISLLGIAPQDEDYFKKESIKCRNGSKKFTRAQLNDDFCDCPDGTDEPGTSACPQGKFYCQNVGYLPISLHSSRVNDGICDCCDGSDEYDGKVKCPNKCWHDGEVARDKLQQKIDMYKEGMAMREKEVEQTKQTIAKDKAELSKLENEEKILRRLVKKLKVRKEQIEKAEEKERLKKEKEQDEKDKVSNESDAEQMESSRSTDDDTEQMESSKSIDANADQHEGDYESIEGFSPEESETTKELWKEELGRFVASRWTGEKTANQVQESGTAKDNHGGNDLNASTYVEEKKGLSGVTTFSSLPWIEKIMEIVQDLFPSLNLFQTSPVKLDANHVRKEYEDASTRFSDTKTRIESLTEKLKHDFGIDKEFYSWYDRCFETKVDKYVYKVCPFKEAYQEEGYSKTQLGEWEKFENSYGTMLFSNGYQCWKGPDRSLKVKLRCGLKTELTDVDEPSRCEYVAVMFTPLRCLERKLKELEHSLESMSNKQRLSHDEL